MTFVEHLANYAAYHRDPRNIATHLIGVPVIVFAVMVLLSRPGFELFGFSLTPATLCFVATLLFYARLSLRFAAIMGILMGLGLVGAHAVAKGSTLQWLSTGIGLFVGGWIVQFIGHYYEGKKPAFVDDLIGLLIGPLFVTVEVLFMLGLCPVLRTDVEARVGPVRRREVTG
ncbi:DUF962 domain-containing protein [Aestuariibacter halophilus]|uniref:DUF962 domain-containing protein n=1 Tax=Fluctibacter halophilus TaxID=226011 RepID=A0ABS8G7N2_9ALTE|nr:Mpo1-like protein [Aestuariibacter halophilus]MCC2616543.1 DUF962 domain-containing protein [Aestuariibacter halophilus]